MPANYDPDSNIGDLTDVEVYAAICYLEPDPLLHRERHADEGDREYGMVICICLYLALLVCLALSWFYWV
jgi:hypothetical protein